MTPATLARRKDFLSVLDFDARDFERCLRLAAQLKEDRGLGRHAPMAAALNGRHVALLFEKPSLRTRITFEIAVRELGGQVVALQPDVALGQREPVADVARNLERWIDAIVIRTFSQRLLGEFAAATRCLQSSTQSLGSASMFPSRRSRSIPDPPTAPSRCFGDMA